MKENKIVEWAMFGAAYGLVLYAIVLAIAFLGGATFVGISGLFSGIAVGLIGALYVAVMSAIAWILIGFTYPVVDKKTSYNRFWTYTLSGFIVGVVMNLITGTVFSVSSVLGIAVYSVIGMFVMFKISEYLKWKMPA